MSTPNPVPPAPVTKDQDPTLGVLHHVVAVAVGAFAGWLSMHVPGVVLSPDTQLEVTGAVVGGVVSLVHYVQARMAANAKNQGK